MNPNTMACPTQQQLTAFVAGKLNETESAEIEQHLAECESCCQVLKLLPDESTLVALLSDKAETAAEDSGRQPSSEAATIPPTAERRTVPPSADMTEIAESPLAASAASIPEPLKNHGRYRILQLLGRGGMGDVYKAHHRMMNRTVALKVINGQLVSSHAAVQRFHREVQAAARLSHPNIVAAYDAEQAGDTHFLVMEFVEGTDLATLVRQRGPLPVAEACEYIRQAAEGLEHAHRLGMVHRDIKPQNLMLSQLRIADCGLRIEEWDAAADESAIGQSAIRNPQSAIPHQSAVVKILDFGLASFVSEAAESSDEAVAGTGLRIPTHLTMLGSMMGTPDYISPEQARDAHSADIRSDIYSLGCTLYCLLSGEPPFHGDSVLDKVMAHVQREPKPLSEYRSDVPPEVEGVLRRMMAKDPAERYQTPGEAAKALVGQASPSKRTAAAANSRGRPSLRGPAALLAVAATLALGLLLALAAAVAVLTDQGWVVIQSEVDDVQIAVIEGGKQIEVLDVATGSQVKWLSTGSYELRLVGNNNDVVINRQTLEMTRLGTVIVTLKWNREGFGPIASFNPPAATITQDGVTVDNGAWKITAPGDRNVRLFEVPRPNFAPGPFFYHAKLKSEGVKGRAYLEMWARFPGEGEFFSKDFGHAISGDNGWAEYEIPFYLKKGEQPDLVKLNLAIEGGGTVWIKDIEFRGRTLAEPAAGPGRQATTPSPFESNLVVDSSLEDTAVGNAFPPGWGNHNAVPKGSYRFELIEGGRTGKHGWLIEGDGQYITLPTNRVAITPGKRYVGRGWVKLKGAGSSAQLRLLYFDAARRYIGETRLDHVAPHESWQTVSIADAIQDYPQTRYVALAMSVMGKGQAVFDDLELIALSPELFVLDRWVGEWDVVQTTPATDAAAAREATGTMRARWIMGNTCVLGEVADENGVVTRIWLEDFDAQAKVYRHWEFASDGTVNGATKSWNEATRSLATVAEASPAESLATLVTTQFSGPDDFKTRVLKRDRAGTTTVLSEDVAMRRKGLPAAHELISTGPAAEPAELAILKPMVGEWSFEMTQKPALWNPEGLKTTGNDQPVWWVLGGRFVMEEGWDENRQQRSVGFWTYDEQQGAFLGWNFMAEGFHARSRSTWDAAANALQIEMLDPPPGCTGKGTIRFIGNHTIDANLVFRDEAGTLLMDGRWLKTRRTVGTRGAIQSDHDRLQGKWAPVSGHLRGKAMTAEQLARMSITFDGNRVELADPDGVEQVQTGTFTIDPDRDPKHIDFIASDGKERVPGIFRFEGDRLNVAVVDGDYARPTDFAPSDLPDHLTATLERAPVEGPALGKEDREVLQAAEAYLAVMDEGRFGALRDMVSSMAKQHVTREQVSQTYQKLRDTFGKAAHRTLHRVQVFDEFPGLPAGRYAGVQFQTDFERQKGLWESLLLNVDTDGQWRVNTYANTLEPMPFPEPKQAPASEQKTQESRAAADQWLKLVDAGKYGEAWDACAEYARKADDRETLVAVYSRLFESVGSLKSRGFKSSEYKTQMPRAPAGEYAVIQFHTQFAKGHVVETVVLTNEANGQWRVSGYFHAEDAAAPKLPPAAPSEPTP